MAKLDVILSHCYLNLSRYRHPSPSPHSSTITHHGANENLHGLLKLILLKIIYLKHKITFRININYNSLECVHWYMHVGINDVCMYKRFKHLLKYHLIAKESGWASSLCAHLVKVAKKLAHWGREFKNSFRRQSCGPIRVELNSER